MALILKSGKTIENPHTGVTFSTAYAVVDHVENNKHQNSQVLRVSIYVTVGDRTARRRPLSTHELNREFSVTGQDWFDFFSVSQVTPATKNLYKQSYLWLLQVTEKDEEDEEDNEVLIFEDWESDE